MSRTLFLSALSLALVVGCSEIDPASPAEDVGQIAPIALSESNVIHRVSVGSGDICPEPCDASFSLIAIERADGSVTGQWIDVFLDPTLPIKVTLDCLYIEGNEAWVSGVVTGPNFAGAPAITRIADNGTSANDPPDQISVAFVDTFGGCQAAPDLPLFDLERGQVKIW